MILRQRDANSGWTSAADGTMEERRNYCQNWRSDVSVILTSAGAMVEWVKFSAYGIPIGLPAGDIDSDFVTDTGDVDAIKAWATAYDVRADLDLDGDIDATDGTLAEGYEGTTLGWTVLSAASVANRLGYAGYHKDINLDISHVRNRVLEPHLGRWTRRDPLGYVDGMSLYEYVSSRSIGSHDPLGLAWQRGGSTQPAQVLPPDGDECVRQSRTLQQCIDCCTVDGRTWFDCVDACFSHTWDPRNDPDRNPSDFEWNNPDCRGNCWRYATCSPSRKTPIPTVDPGVLRLPNCPTCDELKTGMRRDGAVDPDPNTGECPPNSYAIAVMLQTPNKTNNGWCDYHFFRQNPDKRWTDKPGCQEVSPPFDDPKKEWERRRRNDPNYYSNWCGYMCWPYNKTLPY